jgi:D-beta-D-heptose 7-phosphate kinase/D-beta-D-heptose 1-phosphate adenosyltransferase
LIFHAVIYSVNTLGDNQMKISIATGGFDPVHSGHIKYLEAARALGDRLVVGLNSDINSFTHPHTPPSTEPSFYSF